MVDFLLNNLNKLLIIGAGGFGVEVLNWLKDFAESLEYSFLEKILIIDENPEAITSNELKKLWFSNLDNYKFEESDKIIIAIGNPFTRKKIFEQLKKRSIKNDQYFNLVHPSSNISKSAKIKNGFIACPFSVVCPDANIGNHVHLNISSSVGHGAIIDDFSTVSSHCDIMGESKISQGVF